MRNTSSSHETPSFHISCLFRSRLGSSTSKGSSFALLCTVPFSMIFSIKKFFVMGERFFCESFSETKSGKRATYFDPEPSRGLFLERFFCEQEARKMRCRYNESLFGRDLIFRRPVGFLSRKSSQKECFAPLGAVDGAPSTVSAKHSL